jgi:MFS family permease
MTTTVNRPAATGPVPDAPPARRWLVLAVLCLSLLIVTLDNTVLNVVLPTLVRDLNATSSQLQWIVDSYVLMFAGLLLVAGSFADRIGRKRTFMAGLVLFAMDLGLATGAVVAVAGGVIALATLPRRAGCEPTSPEES